MLVIVTDTRIFSAQSVCKDCPLATIEGLPRWKQGQLDCGEYLKKANHQQQQQQPTTYRCQMGFCLMYIE
ncbi:MAG: hypothetical protein WCO81_00445 [Cyanobacteriota bacterium ELA615]